MSSVVLPAARWSLAAVLAWCLPACSPVDPPCAGSACPSAGGVSGGGNTSSSAGGVSGGGNTSSSAGGVSGGGNTSSSAGGVSGGGNTSAAGTGGATSEPSGGTAGRCTGSLCGWQLLSRAQPTGSVDDVAFDPREPRRVYATAGGTFYRSEDSGGNWRAISRAAEKFGVLAFPGQTPGVILAASGNGVIESHDYGDHWQVKSLNGLGLSMLMVHPADRRVVVAALHGEGLLRSLDGGATWSAGTSGIPIGAFDGLAGDPSNPARMWVSVEMPDSAGIMSTELLETTDTGWSWHPVVSTTSGWIRGLAQCAANPNYMIAGAGTHVIATGDAGRTWSRLAWPGVNTDSVAIGGTDCATIFVSNMTGPSQANLYRSLDSGVTVTADNTQGMEALHTPYVRRFAFDPLDPEHILGATAGGLFETRSAADHWQLVPSLGELLVTGMLARPAHGEVWATTWGAGMWRWSSVTNVWSPMTGADFVDHYFTVASSPEDPERIVVGGWGRTLLTEDGGNSYSIVRENENFYSIAFSPTNSTELFAATYWGGILRSVDSGRTWSASAGGIEPLPEGTANPGATYMRSIAFAPDGRIYAGAELRGVYSSLDHGANWTAVSSELRAISVRCLLSSSDGVYACGDSLGVAKLSGDTSEFFNEGLESLTVTGIARDRDGTLFATSEGGVFRRVAGDVWRSLDSDRLPTTNTLTPLVYRDAAGARLIVSTPLGIYSHELTP